VSEKAEKRVVRAVVGVLALVAIGIGLFFSIPQHDRLPGVALGQPDLYRAEVSLALLYAGLLLLMALFHGVLRGALPVEVSQQGAKWPQVASAAKETSDDLEEAVNDLQADLTELGARIAELELASEHSQN
jgi:hypothetical protein